jgi:AbrB family looped-hinge helix DNA binding protein
MKKHECKMKLYGTTTIGPKWQIVIPKEARDLLNMHPWDSVTIITKYDMAVAIIKNEDIKELFEYAKSEWIVLE